MHALDFSSPVWFRFQISFLEQDKKKQLSWDS
jgi:hypothetical protein